MPSYLTPYNPKMRDACNPSPLSVRCFTLGPFATNCYVLWREGSKGCWIIDASFDPDTLIRGVEREGLTPTQLILTHAHCDHIAGVHEILRRWPGIPVLLHEAEKDYPGDPNQNLSAPYGLAIIVRGPDRLLTASETLDLDGLTFRILHTPGHSPGGITLFEPTSGTAFVGDTLFAGSIGRFDYPPSDGRALLRSIREQLLTLPPDTRVLPGHGPETSIGVERDSNPFLQPGGIKL